MKRKILTLVFVACQIQAFTASVPDDTDDSFVAHEWGTFTSVQGADGVQLEWNPLITAGLPRFVYDRNRPTGDTRRTRFAEAASKSAFVTLQRMETPVIYFYSKREQAVDVHVKFPQGLITEWYPQVTQFGPFSTTNRQDLALSQQSFLKWNSVQLLPKSIHPSVNELLPADQRASHYFAARVADADLVRVNSGTKPNQKQEHEGFLFYRGVGSFKAPLQVTLGGNEEYVLLSNPGPEDLGHLFVLHVRQGQGKFLYVDHLRGGENKTVKLNPGKNQIPLSDLRVQIAKQISESLTREGLYERESTAMVQTWDQSWFDEEGLRVLYILPRTWTDRSLPLTFNPTPRELVRVMVGRAEVITPSMEWELLKQIVRFSEENPLVRQTAIEETRKIGLGRFTEPAVRRLLGRTPSRDFSQVAWNLLQESSKLSDEQNVVAQR